MGATEHVPPLHVASPQHVFWALQSPPRATQTGATEHVPPLHVASPQHVSWALQVSPSATQLGASEHVPPLHVASPQHAFWASQSPPRATQLDGAVPTARILNVTVATFGYAVCRSRTETPVTGVVATASVLIGTTSASDDTRLAGIVEFANTSIAVSTAVLSIGCALIATNKTAVVVSSVWSANPPIIQVIDSTSAAAALAGTDVAISIQGRAIGTDSASSLSRSAGRTVATSVPKTAPAASRDAKSRARAIAGIAVITVIAIVAIVIVAIVIVAIVVVAVVVVVIAVIARIGIMIDANVA